MIRTTDFLKIIGGRTVIWTFLDVYPTKLAAKRAAVKAYTETKAKGCIVRQTGASSYVLFSWEPIRA